MEKKVRTKDEVLAELMAEHIALKKVLGNSDRQLGAGRQVEIHTDRDRKLEAARQHRQSRRQQAA